MAGYVCVDGPLEGRQFRWRKPLRSGEPVTVALLDVDHAVLALDYRVRPPAEPTGAGRLEFVSARDAHVRGATSRRARVRQAMSRGGRRVPRPSAG